jgi:hypothetical protein
MTQELYEMSDDETPSRSGFSGVSSGSAPSVLDQLKSTLSKKVERQKVFVEVPERTGITIEVSPNITQHQIRAWRKNAGEDTKQGMDGTKFACSVIAHTTTGIYINGEQTTNEDGVPLTFGSDLILEMTGTSRPTPDCVRAFFGIDPHIEAAAVAILEAAGYSDTVETVDPTKASSAN